MNSKDRPFIALSDVVLTAPVQISVETQRAICKSINSPRLQVAKKNEVKTNMGQQGWFNNLAFPSDAVNRGICREGI